MTDVDLSSPSLDSLETIPDSQVPASEAHGEHEASDVVDPDPHAQLEPDIVHDDTQLQVEPSPEGIAKDADGDLHEPTQEDVFTEPVPAPITEVSKKPDAPPSKRTTPASKDKSTVPAKSAFGKVNSSTPTDKKVRLPCLLGTLASLLTMCWTGFECRHVGCG